MHADRSVTTATLWLLLLLCGLSAQTATETNQTDTVDPPPETDVSGTTILVSNETLPKFNDLETDANSTEGSEVETKSSSTTTRTAEESAKSNHTTPEVSTSPPAPPKPSTRRRKSTTTSSIGTDDPLLTKYRKLHPGRDIERVRDGDFEHWLAVGLNKGDQHLKMAFSECGTTSGFI